MFTHAGMQVTGIEISQTAIDIAHEKYGSDLKITHGSVTDMPFDDELYDGIYCYALIHLLDADERAKVIQESYKQLASGGFMIFVVIGKKDARYLK